MAATLASLWEKKKKVQPNHATNRVELTITEDSACNSEATAKHSQTDFSDSLSDHSQVPAPVCSSKQSLGPDKKRKRAQPSCQQILALEKVLDSRQQPSAEEINSAAKKAALPEQLVKDWLDEQHETQAKKPSVPPQIAKSAAPLQHDPDGSTPSVCVQGSPSLGPDVVALAAAKPAPTNNNGEEDAPGQHPGEAQQASEDFAAAQLTRPNNKTASLEPKQSASKQHLLEQHQAQLKQLILQAQAVKPLADLPFFTDGQLNRPEVRTT